MKASPTEVPARAANGDRYGPWVVGIRVARQIVLLASLVACSSPSVNCGPCGPAVRVLVSGLHTNAPVRACLPDVGSGSSCVTVAVATTTGARRCRVVDNAGRPSQNASCNLAPTAGRAYLIDLRQQRPSAYQGKTVTAGGATGRFEFMKGRGPCGCDQAVASIDLNG